MEEIDWSKAPEGATHWEPASAVDGVLAIWMKHDGGQWFYWPINHGARFNPGWCESDQVKPSRVSRMIPRPTEEWTGEDLPPAGTVCECMCTAKGKERAWFIARVNYMSEHTAVLDSLVDCAELGEFVAHPATMKFRPIRTPDQIAAEQREKAVEAMLALDPYLPNAPLGMMSRAEFCRALYDHGYRKVEGGAQ